MNTAGGALTGCVVMSRVVCRATFTNLRIDTSGAHTLSATGTLSGPGSVSVNSSSFTIAAAAASQLAYTTQPAGATAGSAFGTQPVVTRSEERRVGEEGRSRWSPYH